MLEKLKAEQTEFDNALVAAKDCVAKLQNEHNTLRATLPSARNSAALSDIITQCSSLVKKIETCYSDFAKQKDQIKARVAKVVAKFKKEVDGLVSSHPLLVFTAPQQATVSTQNNLFIEEIAAKDPKE